MTTRSGASPTSTGDIPRPEAPERSPGRGAGFLRIADSLMREIELHAIRAYPHECCGFLLGPRTSAPEEVTAIRTGTNRAEGSETTRFILSPEEFLDVHREADRDDLRVVGFYHSHPDGSAVPSPVDLAAALPGCAYLILGVDRQDVTGTRGWKLTANGRRKFGELTIDSDLKPVAARGGRA